MRVLLIEDDRELGPALRADLQTAGFAVDLACDGVQGEFLGSTEPYDVAILDLGLPNLSGLAVLSQWRLADNPMPVIILTARDAWHEKVDGLKAGADDYLGKPFAVEELIARIRALLRRRHGQLRPVLEFNGLQLDEDQRVVIVGGSRVENLTGAEFRLLRYLMLHPGKVLSKTHLCEHVYASDADPDSNVIEVYINRLRRKLGNEVITTRRGQGYVFEGSA